MKIDLTKDELNTLVYSLYGDLRKLEAEKRLTHRELGEDFDEMYEALIKKTEGLQRKLYGELRTLEDQER